MENRILKIIFFLYPPAIDFIVILFAILFSYKLYLFLDIGKNIYYSNMGTFRIAFLVSFITVLVMKGTDVYRKESGVLNTEEIKNVIKGISYLTFRKIPLDNLPILWDQT